MFGRAAGLEKKGVPQFPILPYSHFRGIAVSSIAGWRIQVSPQYAYSDLSASFFVNVEISDEAAAVALVRNRPDAVAGERIYAVRPLTADDFVPSGVSGL